MCNAAECGYVEVVRVLIKAGANLNDADGRPLLSAVESGDVEVVRVLVEAGADPNQAAEDNTTPLSIAKSLGNAAVLLALTS